MLTIRLFKEMVQKGLTIIGSDDPDVRLGLVEMLEFYELWKGKLLKVSRDWETALGGSRLVAESMLYGEVGC